MANKKMPAKKQKYDREITLAGEPEIELLKLGSSKIKRIPPANKRSSVIANTRKPANHMTSMEKLEMVKKGVTKTELEALKEKAGLDYDTLAQGLSTARATLINIKGEDTFNFAVSEKIVGLEDIYSYGYEVFGDKERFNQWMFRHNKALGNYTPFELVNNQFGREEVKSLIGRIDYGVYA
jgi:putative toxin-antitoxin system antitoxin component (TIGR02293 family)